ncbi:MAG: extracellular solute-binding protein [Treponema sp.]|nr:extracellular solute-binding protein [Treponema sp.]
MPGDQNRFLSVILILAGIIAAGHGIRNVVRTAVPGKTTLVFGLSGKDEGTVRALGIIIEEFEAAHSGIRIVLSEAPGVPEGISAKADILMFDETELGALVRDGALVSLDPWLRAETGNTPWAVPLVSFMDLLFYNIDLLAAAGFDRPPRNRHEFLRCAAAVVSGNRGSRFGAALSLGPEDPSGIRRDVFSWIRAAGVTLAAEGRFLFTGRETVRVLDFLGDLSRQGLLAPGVLTGTGARRLEEFEEGKIALMIASSSAIPRFRRTMREGSFGVGLIPGPPEEAYAGKPVVALHSRYAALSAQCRSPDEAWTFLRFLREKSSVLAAELRAVPGSREPSFAVNAAGVSSYIEEDPLLLKAWDMYGAAEVVHDFEELPAAEELEKALREELVPLLEGRRNGAETAAAVQKRWDALVAADEVP